MATNHDGLFKELLSNFFREFLELFAPDVLEYGDATSIELAGTETFHDSHETGQRRADLVVRVEYVDKPTAFFLIHVEVQSQTQTDPPFATRMFHYFARLHQMHDAPIYPIAVLAYDSLRDEPNTFTVSFPDRDVLKFEFLTVHLRKLNWRDYVNNPNPMAAALMAKMGYTKKERPRVKLECLRLLATLKLDPDKAHLIGRFIESYLWLDKAEREQYTEIMEAMPMAERQAVTEILTYWEQLGLEKGLAQGMEKGLEKGMQEIVLGLIDARFGPVPTADMPAFEQLSPDKLKQLSLAVGKAASYEELRVQFLTSRNGLGD